MQKSNILVYPFFDAPKEKSIDTETISDEKFEELTAHYIRNIMLNVHKLHNFPVDQKFLSDMAHVHESLKATLMRTCGKFHPMQDLFDHIEEAVDDKINGLDDEEE